MISIIIPAQNSATTIARAIKSVFSNDFADIECIVVVNGSTDGTFKICQQLRKKYHRLVIVESAESGVSNARNYGLTLAKGEIIGFCDADDMYESGAIDSVIKEFSKSNADIVITGLYKLKPSGTRIIKHKCVRKHASGMISVRNARRMLISDQAVMGSVWNKFYRREVISTYRFDPDLILCQDMEFNIKVMKDDRLKIFLSNTYTYNYVENSVSATNNAERLFDENDQLRYYKALNICSAHYSDDWLYSLCIGAKRASLAIENYPYCGTVSKRKKLLKSEIRNNLWKQVFTLRDQTLYSVIRYFYHAFLIFLKR